MKKTLYEQYLSALNVLTEEEFDTTLKDIFGEDIDLELVSAALSYIDDNSCFEDRDLVMDIFEFLLEGDWVGSYDIKNKSVHLWDADGIEGLEFIKETLGKYGWTIDNYLQMLTELREENN